MIKTSELIEMGLRNQAEKLSRRLRFNRMEAVRKDAIEWSKIPGVKVNPSFFDQAEKMSFSDEEIADAFKDLGINMKLVPCKNGINSWKTIKKLSSLTH